MSTNHQSTTVAPGNNPDGLRERVAQLIRHYVDTRSPAIAASVVRHIEQLCDHPGFEGDSHERCMFLRLRAHWRWLAASHPASR
ncbi:MAG: ATP dependent RNA helicase [Chromatiaceae bacterium]|nr:ATP dependent RNA helicase [Gammaproteobacteria bacterium]MCP5301317.1 ATP dependent RNA helicase [Chromatiaceae bacterium]MCP5421917.1 ATP dependent RNA helicase [Chromatiaceae bacterium]